VTVIQLDDVDDDLSRWTHHNSSKQCFFYFYVGIQWRFARLPILTDGFGMFRISLPALELDDHDRALRSVGAITSLVFVALEIPRFLSLCRCVHFRRGVGMKDIWDGDQA
jgi:hypothetical protein